MDIKKIIEEKLVQQQKVSQEIAQLNQVVNLKTQEALRLDGAIKQLQELDKEGSKPKDDGK